MLKRIKDFFKKAVVTELPKEPSLSDKIFQRVTDDLLQYPAHEWKNTRCTRDTWEHPHVPYVLEEQHYLSMEIENIPYGVLDTIHKSKIMKLWRSQLQAYQDKLEKEKFDDFLNKTGL